MTTDTPPPTPRAITETLRAHPGGVSDDLLVAIVAAKTNAERALGIRATIGRLEKCGEIYSPDEGATWKVTTL
jgi:hypothetical protein